ncbi:MAG TPA: hypothetical protein VIL85_00930, partial [Thermomicrobiales bacterium]
MDERTPTASASGNATWDDLPEEVRLRLQAPKPQPVPTNSALSPRMRAFVLAVDRGVLAVARHWVLAVNIIGGLYAGFPLLGPWLLSKGFTIPANVIYFMYKLTCH